MERKGDGKHKAFRVLTAVALTTVAATLTGCTKNEDGAINVADKVLLFQGTLNPGFHNLIATFACDVNDGVPVPDFCKGPVPVKPATTPHP